MRRVRLIVSVATLLFFSAQAHASDIECVVIPTPAKSLATESKYDQSDSSRSIILDDKLRERDVILRPVRQSIAALTQLSLGTPDDMRQGLVKSDCINENVVRWAQEKALTEMDSADSYLARDRFISDIMLTLMSTANGQPMNAADREVVANWLTGIADSTVEYYDLRAGRNARMNNHRYWAGLAVGAIGFFLESEKYQDWGRRSFHVGVCQVDAAGYLPLELSRGALALEYHIYALRPLQALATLAASRGRDFEGDCDGGLSRLRNQTLAAIRNPDAISERAGVKQIIDIRESTFIAPLQLAALGLL